MEVIDNVGRLLGDDLKAELRSPGAKLKIAASCFSMYAYEALKAELGQLGELQFIFTSPAFVADEVTDKLRKERREFHIPKRARERSLYGSEFELVLRNQLSQRAIAKECAAWLRARATFRSNRGAAPMQQFACAQHAANAAVYLPLHGFTAVDLGYQRGDAVSNIVTKLDEPAHATKYLSLFDQLWSDPNQLQDVTEQVCDHIASVYRENAPESVYYLVLYHIFAEFLDAISDDVLPNDRTGYQDTLIWKRLFNYQRDAVTGIINKLETYNGCILADSVGLGKTFSALAVIKYYELRNRTALVLCPKKLADNWRNYNSNLTTNLFAADHFRYDVLCHTDLSRTTGESLGIALNRVNWGNYDLVVIDESHNFRNNNADDPNKETRYQKLLNKVIRQGVKTKVLMLSATPVNNRFTDLRNQLALAHEGEPDQLGAKLTSTSRSIEEIFRRAQATFNNWTKLPPQERTASAILGALDFDFFELLDSVTIARSRKHIQTFYDTKDIGTFPERKPPLSFRCPLTDLADAMSFNDIFAKLSALTLAVYTPGVYLLASRRGRYMDGNLNAAGREQGLRALMTVNLLKRLESSVASFRLTLQVLHENHQRALERIETFRKTGEDIGITDIGASTEDLDEDDDAWADPANGDGKKVTIALADLDLPSWESALLADLVHIEELMAAMAKITPTHDAKLQHLKHHIADKLKHPINSGNRKILVFTAFADTADYLYEQLAPALLKEHGLHSAKITGTGAPQATLRRSAKRHYDFQELLTLFSPRSKEKAATLPDEAGEIDLLIGTDCISEGQNLQDCDYLINYDIHWNPVRIIQRFGRIDRIGSTNATIQLVNYWPDISLDQYISLRERVESRMMIVDVTATGDDNVLSAEANDISYRKEQLRRLQTEVIELEELKTGVAITDLGLNDFRMDLLNYAKAQGDLEHMPTGLHAVVPANPALGLPPGVIFTLRNRRAEINQPAHLPRHNRLHPYYLVYVGDDGEIVHDYTEVKRLLDLARACSKGYAEPLAEVCRQFNDATADGRDMQAYSRLLDRAIGAIVETKEEKELDSLFSGGKTTALVGQAPGADDFELIAFLVIWGGR